MIINTPVVVLMAHTPNPEYIIEQAARVCYNSKTPADRLANQHLGLTNPFLRGVIKSGHDSVLEHASATFEVTNVSRALTHQLVRHRLCSFSQQSQRYVKSDQFEYVTPPSVIALDDKLESDPNFNHVDEYNADMCAIQNMYDKWINRGLKPEDARFVLPNACTTKLWISANFRQWRTLLKLRLDTHAQWEIRELSNIILKLLFDIAPNVFADLVEV